MMVDDVKAGEVMMTVIIERTVDDVKAGEVMTTGIVERMVDDGR